LLAFSSSSTSLALATLFGPVNSSEALAHPTLGTYDFSTGADGLTGARPKGAGGFTGVGELVCPSCTGPLYVAEGFSTMRRTVGFFDLCLFRLTEETIFFACCAVGSGCGGSSSFGLRASAISALRMSRTLR
jgi:hypothetical protein